MLLLVMMILAKMNVKVLYVDPRGSYSHYCPDPLFSINVHYGVFVILLGLKRAVVDGAH